MSTKHEHKFYWHDRTAYYKCQCGTQEALCVYCGKRSGQPIGKVHWFCSPKCEKKWNNLGDGCQGVEELIRWD